MLAARYPAHRVFFLSSCSESSAGFSIDYIQFRTAIRLVEARSSWAHDPSDDTPVRLLAISAFLRLGGWSRVRPDRSCDQSCHGDVWEPVPLDPLVGVAARFAYRLRLLSGCPGVSDLARAGFGQPGGCGSLPADVAGSVCSQSTLVAVGQCVVCSKRICRMCLSHTLFVLTGGSRSVARSLGWSGLSIHRSASADPWCGVVASLGTQWRPLHILRSGDALLVAARLDFAWVAADARLHTPLGDAGCHCSHAAPRHRKSAPGQASSHPWAPVVFRRSSSCCSRTQRHH